MRVLLAHPKHQMLAHWLRSVGRVDHVPDGTSALERVCDALSSGAPFALYCVAFGLPDMDGLLLIRQIRACEQEHGAARSQALLLDAVPLSERGVHAQLHALGLVDRGAQSLGGSNCRV